MKDKILVMMVVIAWMFIWGVGIWQITKGNYTLAVLDFLIGCFNLLTLRALINSHDR